MFTTNALVIINQLKTTQSVAQEDVTQEAAKIVYFCYATTNYALL